MDSTGWDYDWEGPRSRSEGKQREQDEALIRQLVEALENSSDLVFKDTTKADARDLAITAGRARLESKP